MTEANEDDWRVNAYPGRWRTMNIGIVGAGNLGTGLAKRLIAQGHDVMLSFTRSDETLRNAAAALNARAGTPSDAARFGHVVILSSKWADTAEAIGQIGSIAETKVLWDCTNPMKRYNLVARYDADPGSAVSANLYAYDFMTTTSAGLLFKGDPNRKENWLSYGEPIFAPADGLVIEMVSDLPENTFTSNGKAQSPSVEEAKDPMGFGNHVKIQHADGRVSWLLHMQPNSIRVRVGDHVRAEEPIGKVGFSGDSLFPHLHYNVTDGPNYPSQGVPSYFKHFVRVLGQRRIPMSKARSIPATWSRIGTN
jgi:hypothetical protein